MPRKYAGPLRPGERSAKVPRTYRKRMARQSTSAKTVRSILFKTLETKYKSINFAKTELNHNTLAYLANSNIASQLPIQGDGDDQRIGDQMYLTGIKFRMMLGQKADRPNVTFKIWVVEFNSNAGNANDKNLFFHNISDNVLLDSRQTNRFKVLKSMTIRSKGTSLEVGETAKEQTRPLSFWLPMKRKITYLGDASQVITTGMKENIFVLMAAYDAYGTLASDNIAYAVGNATYYYKDP